MVCSSIVRRTGLWAGVMVLAVSPAAIGQPAAQRTDTLAAALNAVLTRAATTATGTYVVSNGTIDGARQSIPIVVQPDFLRGPERTVRVPVSLGATVADAATVRIRVVTPTDGQVIGEVSGAAAAGQVHFVDEFRLSPGQYDIHAVVGHRQPGGGFVVSLSKTLVTVPDVWEGRFIVTPLVLGEAATAAPAGSAGRPFTFGQTALTPAAGNHFTRSAGLNLAFRIYNWTARAGETPDLTVEYVFHELTPSRSVFFNKTKPQRLTNANLGGTFDNDSGMVCPGMAVALQSFTFGQFQVTVRVTDNRTKQTVTQQTTFAVSPGT
jgi:hypothetical protein